MGTDTLWRHSNYGYIWQVRGEHLRLNELYISGQSPYKSIPFYEPVMQYYAGALGTHALWVRLISNKISHYPAPAQRQWPKIRGIGAWQNCHKTRNKRNKPASRWHHKSQLKINLNFNFNLSRTRSTGPYKSRLWWLPYPICILFFPCPVPQAPLAKSSSPASVILAPAA